MGRADVEAREPLARITGFPARPGHTTPAEGHESRREAGPLGHRQQNALLGRALLDRPDVIERRACPQRGPHASSPSGGQQMRARKAAVKR